MSFDRDNPILIGAAIIVLMGEQDDDDFMYFDKFCTAMECFDYEVLDCYHVVEDIDNAYYDR